MATYTEIPITAPAPGNFSVAHGLGRVPNGATPPAMTAAGIIRFQAARFDVTNLLLSASDAGLTARIFVW